VRYQEKLEKGWLRRMQSELSPTELRRRKFELEKWVTAEQDETKKGKRKKDLTIFEMDQERDLAKRIIESVKRTTKDIKERVQRKSRQVLPPPETLSVLDLGPLEESKGGVIIEESKEESTVGGLKEEEHDIDLEEIEIGFDRLKEEKELKKKVDTAKADIITE